MVMRQTVDWVTIRRKKSPKNQTNNCPNICCTNIRTAGLSRIVSNPRGGSVVSVVAYLPYSAGPKTASVSTLQAKLILDSVI